MAARKSTHSSKTRWSAFSPELPVHRVSRKKLADEFFVNFAKAL